MRRIYLFLIVVLTFSFVSCGVSITGEFKDSIVGTWKLYSYNDLLVDGENENKNTVKSTYKIVISGSTIKLNGTIDAVYNNADGTKNYTVNTVTNSTSVINAWHVDTSDSTQKVYTFTVEMNGVITTKVIEYLNSEIESEEHNSAIVDSDVQGAVEVEYIIKEDGKLYIGDTVFTR